MADFVACGLFVPLKDLFINHRAWGFCERERVGQKGCCGLWAVRQGQEPVSGDAKRGGTFAHHLRIGQARALT